MLYREKCKVNIIIFKVAYKIYNSAVNINKILVRHLPDLPDLFLHP